ncbi:type II toxin-antitoxin system RelE/ParE family toxin [Ciceribacter sp. L1K22]|uniref:type II toxin-antitoxin system RelE/ParE family toxin n=1 Tax=Ciceribacter sp. L1K22 TaxID=2820275 RepID=UPI001ABE02F2|nr:type II toxin-antitoxin system RelE/ParE family toxin [Ciceribacter sp. L1K22]MBO3762099.1 type II toxin-antitoxin system RelE/ParE family toxin [Ciceribacter sp. L1K22]
MKVVWTRRYLGELAAIGDYIGDRNPSAAYRIVNEIHSKTGQLLLDNPFIGRRGDIPGTRELVLPGTPYVVAYRVRDDSIEVLFVQHGARLWPDE